jgi:hypothetical protein
MLEFITNLTLVEKVFFFCAVVGGGVFLIRFILLLFGGFGDVDMETDAGVDMDMDADIGDMDIDAGDAGLDAGAVEGLDADGAASFHLLSIQGVTGFFMMFGLVGLTMARQSGFGDVISIAGATCAGFATMLIIAKVYSVMRLLQSSGTLNLRNAIGKEGMVYLTIPAEGTGKIRVVIQDGLKVFNAVSADKKEIKTDERIKVVKVVSGNVFVVKKL